MVCSIKVFNSDNLISWERKLTVEEFDKIKSYVKGSHVVPIIRATLKPVRTNNLKNFGKDFFLPTVANQAVRIQHSAGRVFAILGALILDSLTFPIRLLTCVPRVISNAYRKENLLRKYLLNQGVEAKLIESDHVRVRLEWEKMSQYPTSHWRTSDGVKHSKHSQEKHWSEENINFIEVPIYPGYDRRESGISG